MTDTPEFPTQSDHLPGSDSELAHVRPTTSLELLDRTFAIMRARPGLFLGLGALAALPGTIVQILFFWKFATQLQQFQQALAATEPANWMSPHPPALIQQMMEAYTEFFPWQVGAWMLAQWPVSCCVACAFQTLLFPRRPLGFRAAMQGTFARLPHFILTRALTFAVLSVTGVTGLLVPNQIASSGGGALMAFVAVWMLIATCYFGTMWAAVPQVVMVERRSFIRAIARSMEIMRVRYRRGWFGDSAVRRLALVLLIPISIWLTGKLIVLGMDIARGGPLQVMAPATMAGIVIGVIVGFVTAAVNMPLFQVAMTLIYAESRMRTEALDVQVRLLSRGENAPPEPYPANLT